MGTDLLDSIQTEFSNRGMSKAHFSLIGAVTSAVLGYYDQVARKYMLREFEGHFEIVHCIGNVSEKEGSMFVHAHIALAGPEFACFGGHLMPGTTIFAAELSGHAIEGPTPTRELDHATGLALWRIG